MPAAHVAPLGLGGFCYPVCYTHIAPLGLRRKDLSSGYRHVAPLGLNTANPLSRFTHHVLRSVPIHRNPSISDKSGCKHLNISVPRVQDLIQTIPLNYLSILNTESGVLPAMRTRFDFDIFDSGGGRSLPKDFHKFI